MPRDPAATRQVLEGNGQAQICPSVLSCDFSKLADEIEDAKRAGAAVVQWDVMDGHFVPNLSYGAMVIKDCRAGTDLVFDTHLMISEPERYLDDFLAAGCDTITVHIEAVPDPGSLLAQVRKAGALAGLAINPPTPIETLVPWLDQVDIINVMSVPPGFGGQTFDPAALDKLRWLRENAPPTVLLEVDGGVNRHTIGDAARAGARLLVVGSAFYKAGDRTGEYRALTDLANGR